MEKREERKENIWEEKDEGMDVFLSLRGEKGISLCITFLSLDEIAQQMAKCKNIFFSFPSQFVQKMR